MTLKEMKQTRRTGLLNVKSRPFKCEEETNDYMLNYEQVLVMFLKGEKVNFVHYWWNIVVKLKVNKWSFSNGSATENQKY